ncbi:hypothetical protein BLNAU_4514 [Blattamonas nauphoetae]|uniref:Poly(A) RNA polymerase mitochondrial-like central palm domain-containing protein n=1 Tax=Blattamonas nauphoetae TaxID=2049346 RepID=A0ABQ9YA45_9EUKA|nr:hypothetical protein BLNAU_4514 [Blattamonas nauphoetae]
MDLNSAIREPDSNQALRNSQASPIPLLSLSAPLLSTPTVYTSPSPSAELTFSPAWNHEVPHHPSITLNNSSKIDVQITSQNTKLQPTLILKPNVATFVTPSESGSKSISPPLRMTPIHFSAPQHNNPHLILHQQSPPLSSNMLNQRQGNTGSTPTEIPSSTIKPISLDSVQLIPKNQANIYQESKTISSEAETKMHSSSQSQQKRQTPFFPFLTCPPSYKDDLAKIANEPRFFASDECLQRIETTRTEIESVLIATYPALVLSVELYGSCRSGVLTVDSDMDFTVITRPPDAVREFLRQQRMDLPDPERKVFDEECVLTIEMIGMTLEKAGFYINDVISFARVPVVKGRAKLNVWKDNHSKTHQSPSTESPTPASEWNIKPTIADEEWNPEIKYQDCTSFDIVLNNHLGVHNSELIKTYCQLDDRVRSFLVLVKEWSKAWGIANTREGTLSSYGWTLLALNYLQMCEVPVIPSLQHRHYLEASDPSHVVWVKILADANGAGISVSVTDEERANYERKSVRRSEKPDEPIPPKQSSTGLLSTPTPNTSETPKTMDYTSDTNAIATLTLHDIHYSTDVGPWKRRLSYVLPIPGEVPDYHEFAHGFNIRELWTPENVKEEKQILEQYDLFREKAQKDPQHYKRYENTKTVTELFVGFVDYYNWRFIRRHYVASIKHGQVLTKLIVGWVGFDSSDHMGIDGKLHALSILDPFEKERDVGDVVWNDTAIWEAMRGTRKMIEQSEPISKVLGNTPKDIEERRLFMVKINEQQKRKMDLRLREAGKHGGSSKSVNSPGSSSQTTPHHTHHSNSNSNSHSNSHVLPKSPSTTHHNHSSDKLIKSYHPKTGSGEMGSSLPLEVGKVGGKDSWSEKEKIDWNKISKENTSLHLPKENTSLHLPKENTSLHLSKEKDAEKQSEQIVFDVTPLPLPTVTLHNPSSHAPLVTPVPHPLHFGQIEFAEDSQNNTEPDNERHQTSENSWTQPETHAECGDTALGDEDDIIFGADISDDDELFPAPPGLTADYEDHSIQIGPPPGIEPSTNITISQIEPKNTSIHHLLGHLTKPKQELNVVPTEANRSHDQSENKEKDGRTLSQLFSSIPRLNVNPKAADDPPHVPPPTHIPHLQYPQNRHYQPRQSHFSTRPHHDQYHQRWNGHTHKTHYSPEHSSSSDRINSGTFVSSQEDLANHKNFRKSYTPNRQP